MNSTNRMFAGRKHVLLLLAGILVVYGISFYKRYTTYSHWMEKSSFYVVDNIITMTEYDSFYWLEMAKELDMGTLGNGQPDPTKSYPDLAPFAIKDQPGLLAELISFGKNFTGGNYYRSGLLLIPLLSGLFVFPLFYYFNRLGFGASAVLGGLIGSFSHAYYDRTMMGRVDTDLLNTFFPITMACFILSMSREKSCRVNLALTIGAGLTMYLFNWWYQQPIFILLFLLFMVLHLLIGRVVSWKYLLLLLLVFPLASGPGYVLQIFDSLRTFLWTYVSPPVSGQIVWPDIMSTIAEARPRGFAISLEKMHGFLPLVFAGFTGLIYLYVRRFRQMIPITPLVVLGVWSLFGPHRFAMYLAPLVGVGAGVLIEALVNYSGEKVRLPKLAMSLVSMVLMFSLFFATSTYTGYSKLPLPVIKTKTIAALLDIKNIVPQYSAMFTPFWEYGYPLMNIGEFATYHDGGTQGGIRTTLTAKGMMSANQQDIVSLLAYLEEHGFNQLSQVIRKDKLTPEQMMSLAFDYQGPFHGGKVYILYLEEMLEKFSSMSYSGTWNFERKANTPLDYVYLTCSLPVNNLMNCREGRIDLIRGVVSNGTNLAPLMAALFVNNGYIVNRIDYTSSQGYYLQVLMKNSKIFDVQMVEPPLFWSNFNQQYLLGNYDRRYFEEVYNDFPVARVLKIKSAQPDRQGPAR